MQYNSYELRTTVWNREQAAYDRYHAKYDNDMYILAYTNRPERKGILVSETEWANMLTDYALALCEHPHYSILPNDLALIVQCQESVDYLMRFVDVWQ